LTINATSSNATERTRPSDQYCREEARSGTDWQPGSIWVSSTT